MDWEILWRYRWILADGALTTVELSVLGIVGSTLLGLMIAAADRPSSLLGRDLARSYTEIVRNVPSIVKVFILYYVVGFDAFDAGVLGLSIHQSAYIADVFGSGLRGIPREQTESGRVLGYTYRQIFVYVQVPQLLRAVGPPLTSQYIEVVKNSSIVMFLGLPELTYYTQQIEFETGQGYVAATAVTLLYLALAIVISSLMALTQRLLRYTA
jgi:polar amino acid transport system permease protein